MPGCPSRPFQFDSEPSRAKLSADEAIMVGALEEEELVGLNVQQLEYRQDTPTIFVLSQLCSLPWKHDVCL